MTTVAYLNGVLASDSLYHDGNGVDISVSRSNASELSPPKIVKYELGAFTLLCGCAGVSNLMAATQDFFVKNYGQLSHASYRKLVLDLPHYLDQYVTDSQRECDKLLLEIILVTCLETHVLRYNIQEKQFYLPDDQFPSIGSGSDAVKEIYNLSPLAPCVEIVSRAAKQDCCSGGEIVAVSLNDVSISNCRSGLIVNSQQRPIFLESLNTLMGI